MLWYLLQVKNILGLGARISSPGRALVSALLSAAVANAVFLALQYFLF